MIHALTITPHCSWHRWQQRAPQGSFPFFRSFRMSSRLSGTNGVICDSAVSIAQPYSPEVVVNATKVTAQNTICGSFFPRSYDLSHGLNSC